MDKRIGKTTLALMVASTLIGCQSTKNTESLGYISEPYECAVPMVEQSQDLRIYQVMVESFVNGNDSIGHGTGYGTSHHKGDLQGVIDSLDYIQSLGMNAIWLTPIFNSIPDEGQNHWADRLDATGYFTSDYFSIDPRFGDMDKARELVEAAHAKGMYVFLDGVFGHHKDNLVPSPQGRLPAGDSNPVDYPESLAFYQEVASYWVKELKIDGWRLDQAYQVPLPAWKALRKSVDQASQSVTYQNAEGEAVHPLGYMVAEIWNNENYITRTGYGPEKDPALCSAFDFPVRYRVVETFAVNENSNGGKGGEWLAEGMKLHDLYPPHAKPNLMLGNHDLVRFGDLLQRGNIAKPDQAEYWARHRAALSFLGAYNGPITLYYGEEVGDEVPNFADKASSDICALQGYCDDHVARSSAKIDGVTTQLNQQQTELRDYVASLMTLREQHPAIVHGKRTSVLATDAVYVDHKQKGDDALLYMVSTQAKANMLTLKAADIASEGVLVDLQTNVRFEPVNGEYQIPLSGFQARFLEIEKPSNAGVKIETTSAVLTGKGFMAQCDNPTVAEAGPKTETMYVVGDFADSGWKHKDNRAYSYKGDNTYQVVVDEVAGAYRMQYATKDWSPQYTAEGLELKPGQEKTLQFGGYGKDTAVTLPVAGRYVWSLKFSDQGSPRQIMVSKCDE